MFDSLRSFSDSQVLSSTDGIIVEDRKLTLRLLVHLHEIERRKLYLKRGYSSMFVYCTKHLKLSEPAAARRIRTARSLTRFPQLYALLESGDVNLSTVSMVSKYLKPENVADILARIRGCSRREVERVVAELEPRATLPPDSVRVVMVPVPVSGPTALPQFTVAGDSEKSPSVEAMRAAQNIQSPAAAIEVQLERRAVISFTTHEELIEKLERIRSVASHRLPATASLEQLIDFMADYILRREDPTVRQHRREARAARTEAKPMMPANPRQVPAPLRDQVFTRDKHCTYRASNGKRCESTHLLQIDHIVPVARGGASTLDNLRLLCAYHNRLESERVLGRREHKNKNATA